ncbi:CPBP family intramembrane glutamic endopeptidase [Cupriavidus pauculus]|uniref:CPBP family intramembrane metalloprotease n=1 Tax=Cupriavidus pauculus TaxID=82633 RepID=A0A2N5CHQ5_9BURK|nr:type II CAAX endopeptidase family protein [Cupriavidus pauculus]PLQ01744.1 CPBP family intramembrane metalloprotease [Cupriavidus pauculus]
MNRPVSDIQPISLQWALALTFVAWFVELMVATLLRPMLVRSGLEISAAASLVRILACGIVFSVLLHQSGLTYRRLFHDSRSSAVATIGLLGLPILMTVPLIVLLDGVMMTLLEKVLPLSASEVAMFESMAGGLGNWVLSCAIAPMVEEMFFRGIILRGMLKRYATTDAIVYSAFVFGLMHLNVYQFVIAFAVGILAAAFYVRTGSLWPGIVLHAGINTTITVMSESGTDADTQYSLWTWSLAVVAGLVGALVLRRMLWRPTAVAQQAGADGADPEGPPPDAA